MLEWLEPRYALSAPTVLDYAPVIAEEDTPVIEVALDEMFSDIHELTYEVVGNTDFSLLDHWHICGDTLTLYPAPDQNGTTVLAVLATDESGLNVVTSLDVTLTPVDDAPVITSFDAWIWIDIIFIQGTVTDIDSPVMGDRVFIGGEYRDYDVYVRSDGSFRTAIRMDAEILDVVFLTALAHDPVNGGFSDVVSGYFD